MESNPSSDTEVFEFGLEFKKGSDRKESDVEVKETFEAGEVETLSVVAAVVDSEVGDELDCRFVSALNERSGEHIFGVCGADVVGVSILSSLRLSRPRELLPNKPTQKQSLETWLLTKLPVPSSCRLGMGPLS